MFYVAWYYHRGILASEDIDTIISRVKINLFYAGMSLWQYVFDSCQCKRRTMCGDCLLAVRFHSPVTSANLQKYDKVVIILVCHLQAEGVSVAVETTGKKCSLS